MKKIWIVDAFTHSLYSGNPAAVMIIKEFPCNMQAIAAEMNLSETAFVKILPEENCFHIRWFTPFVEVNLCGHATLAAAHILFQEKLIQGDSLKFNSLSGDLRVKLEQDSLVLDFPLQKIDQQLSAEIYPDVLNVKSCDVIEAFKVEDEVIVRLKDEDILKNLKPDFSKILKLDEIGIIVTVKSSEYDFISRCFAPKVGINEDPVTGSAHCKLAHYWSLQLGKTEFTAYQASLRGGIIGIKIQNERVLLKGKAVTVMEGKWLIDDV